MIQRTYKTGLLLCTIFLSVATQAQETASEWFAKANVLYNNKNYAEAAPAYEKAGSLNTKSLDAFYKAGWCYKNTIRQSIT